MLEIMLSPEALGSLEVMNTMRSPLVSIGSIFQLIVSLGVVVGLIYLAARYILPKVNLPTNGQIIEVLDRVGLEPGVTAYTLGAEGKKYLVVVGAKQATLIAEIGKGKIN